uniref:Dirigent protein n=1 Tax=Lactuca sativa TaxID=4236 RepID=A0A9R1WXK6_LACSA|nr:hypothetical protein LSAT_V11C800439670 [Lactuca sativa]
MTVERDPRSMMIGKGQGFSGSASLEQPGFLMNMNFVFTQGKFNGSTLQVFGTNPIRNQFREMSVVGGTGVFRLARGIATFRNESSFPLRSPLLPSVVAVTDINYHHHCYSTEAYHHQLKEGKFLETTDKLLENLRSMSNDPESTVERLGWNNSGGDYDTSY